MEPTQVLAVAKSNDGKQAQYWASDPKASYTLLAPDLPDYNPASVQWVSGDKVDYNLVAPASFAQLGVEAPLTLVLSAADVSLGAAARSTRSCSRSSSSSSRTPRRTELFINHFESLLCEQLVARRQDELAHLEPRRL